LNTSALCKAEYLCVAALWLDADEVIRVEEEQASEIVDLTPEWDIQTAQESVLFSPSGLFLRKKSDVVRLRVVEDG
jgi:hypothetical protein